MGDLALTYSNGSIDLDLGDGGTAIDNTLRTAAIISLFSDRRAEPDDPLPDSGDDRRGWWGDIYPEAEGDRIGSRLWLLAREKQMPQVLRRAETYARQALQWLIEDNVASAVTVTASFVQSGALSLHIRIATTYENAMALTVLVPAQGSELIDEAGGIILDESGAALLE